MLKAAIRSSALGFTLWAQDDEHGLPKDLGSPLDESFVPFDAFQVFRDRYFESKGCHGDAFACRDVTWWSPEVSVAYRHSSFNVMSIKLILETADLGLLGLVRGNATHSAQETSAACVPSFTFSAHTFLYRNTTSSSALRDDRPTPVEETRDGPVSSADEGNGTFPGLDQS